MDEKIETNYMVAKSSKKYAVLKKTALKTDFGWWSYAWSKKIFKMSPIVMWQILTWPTKNKNPALPNINLWQSIYNKIYFKWITFCRISDVHFYNNVTFK